MYTSRYAQGLFQAALWEPLVELLSNPSDGPQMEFHGQQHDVMGLPKPNTMAAITTDAAGNTSVKASSSAAFGLKNNGLNIQSLTSAYTQFPGYEFDSLASLTGWTPTTTGGATITTTTLSDGTAGIAFTLAAGASTAFISQNCSIPYSQNTVLGLWVEFSDPGQIATIQVAFANESGAFTNWNYLSFGASGGGVWKGLYYINQPISKSSVGGGTFAASGVIQTIRLRILSSYKNQGGTVKFRSLNVSKMGRPKVGICFDDGYTSQYTEAFRYMSRYGMVGTIAIVPNLVGTGGKATLAQLKSMYAAGWAVVGHTQAHTAFNSYNLTSIATSQTPLAAGNLTLDGTVGTATFDAPRCLVIKANDQGLKLTITGTGEDGVTPVVETFYTWSGAYWTATQNVFTKVTQIAVDQAASGAITVGQSNSYAETVTAISGSRDYLLNNGMPRGAYDFVLPQGEFNPLVLRALAATGMRSARVVSGQMQTPVAGDFRKYQLPGFGGGGAGLTNTVLSGYRTDAINAGSNILIYMHDIVTTASLSTEVARAEFQAFVDATAADAAAGKCDIVTQLDFPVA